MELLSQSECDLAYAAATSARNTRDLHCAVTRLLLDRLAREITEVQPPVYGGAACALPPAESGVAFFVAAHGEHPSSATLLRELEEVAAQSTSIRARGEENGERILGYLAGWVTQEVFELRLAHLGFQAVWLPKCHLRDREKILALMDQLGVVFTLMQQIDLFDSLPWGRQEPKDNSSRLPDPTESGVFDYSGDPPEELTPDTLCYSRCRWWPEEGRGVCLERLPRTCWEGAHNARLQAAAPLLFETLRAVSRGDAGWPDQVQAALQAVKDPEWVEWILNPQPSQASLRPLDVMAKACRPER